MEHKEYLKNTTMYQVYVRNHTEKGTFNALVNDLARIKDLGVDIIYLLPIHPLGALSRKGTLGSPYAIVDYYAINPKLGTLQDFKNLVAKAHELGLKVMLDIVLHHTSPDAVLLDEHPAFYFYKDGKVGNKVGDWSDIIDLDYNNRDLWVYMRDMLAYWARFGVDGFRADVAPLIPLAFWRYIRTELDAKFPELIWLSESVEPGFITYLRANDHVAHTDVEMYAAFDVLYDYDVYPHFKAFLEGKAPLSTYINKVKAQEELYPKGYLKIRTIENHDIARIAALCQNETLLRNVTAWSFFQNGLGFLYGGQEVKATHLPSLFDKDTIDLTVNDDEFYAFIKTLIKLKKHTLFRKYDTWKIVSDDAANTVTALRSYGNTKMYGFFNFTKNEVVVNVALNDGYYHNLLGGEVEVRNNTIVMQNPIIILL